MVAVADSSSLIALSICNHLNLLDMLFDKVIVPEAVYDELTLNNKPESKRLKDYLLDKVSKKLRWLHIDNAISDELSATATI